MALASVAVGCLGLVVILSLSASASTQRAAAHEAGRTVADGHSHRHGSRHAVTVGSTWTLYDYQHGPKSHAFCEVFTFDTNGVVSGDAGDVGTWTSTNRITTLTVASSAALPRGKFTGKAMFDGQYAGEAVQKGANGGRYGPLSLVSGSDPFGEGGC